MRLGSGMFSSSKNWGRSMEFNEEQDRFYALLGRCIAQWAHVEDGLHGAYFAAINQSSEKRTENLAAQAAFYAVQSPETKIRVANAAVTFRLLSGMKEDRSDPRRKLLALWRHLNTRAKAKKNRRNQLAHFQVLINASDDKPGRRIALRPALFNPIAALNPTQPFHCAELDDIRASFGRLSFDLDVFAYGLAKQLGQFVPGDALKDHLAGMLTQLGDETYEEPGLPIQSTGT
jgi:hypothetical protein